MGVPAIPSSLILCIVATMPRPSSNRREWQVLSWPNCIPISFLSRAKNQLTSGQAFKHADGSRARGGADKHNRDQAGAVANPGFCTVYGAIGRPFWERKPWPGGAVGHLPLVGPGQRGRIRYLTSWRQRNFRRQRVAFSWKTPRKPQANHSGKARSAAQGEAGCGSDVRTQRQRPPIGHLADVTMKRSPYGVALL